jgi:hypothetical protein
MSYKIIQLLHLILIITILISVFIPDLKLKKLSITLLLFIFFQFITNFGKCGLTELEYAIRGEKCKEGFIYRLVKPIITVPEKYFDQHMYWIHVLWILILGYQLSR